MSTTILTPYEDLLQEILETGNHKEDRTGTGTLSLFGKQLRYDLSDSFPLITTKKVAWKSLVGELLWFIKGDTNNNSLLENNIRIWDAWRRPILSTHRQENTVKKLEEQQLVKDSKPLSIESQLELDAIDKELYLVWQQIIKDIELQENNLTMSSEWLDASVFLQEVKEIPQYWYREHDTTDSIVLYPNYYGNNHYSKETTIWEHKDIVKEYEHNDANYDCERLLLRKEIIRDGDLGRIYGSQWRSWGSPNGGTVDQLAEVIKQIKETPDSRRMIVSAWNVSMLDDMALPPCHLLFQFYVADGKLSCQLYQRSADMFLGVPFNIASYSLLTHMVAQQVGLDVGEFIWTGGDCHIYTDHIDQVKEQLSRQPREYPQLDLTHRDSIDDYVFEDCKVVGYDPHPIIRGKVSI